jgi:hypothetical protein
VSKVKFASTKQVEYVKSLAAKAGVAFSEDRLAGLTIAQASALIDTLRVQAEAARKAAFAAKAANDIDVKALAGVPAWVAGKATVEGTVTSAKEKFTQFGAAWKMVVADAQERKVFVTVPRAWVEAIEGIHGRVDVALKGCAVRMDVTVEPSENDPFFAFGARPANAKIVTKGEAYEAAAAAYLAECIKADHDRKVRLAQPVPCCKHTHPGSHGPHGCKSGDDVRIMSDVWEWVQCKCQHDHVVYTPSKAIESADPEQAALAAEAWAKVPEADRALLVVGA